MHDSSPEQLKRVDQSFFLRRRVVKFGAGNGSVAVIRDPLTLLDNDPLLTHDAPCKTHDPFYYV